MVEIEIDDELIQKNMDILNGIIKEKYIDLQKFEKLHSVYSRIVCKTIQKVNNDGEVVTEMIIPNPQKLSDSDNKNIRQILYVDCNKKFEELKL